MENVKPNQFRNFEDTNAFDIPEWEESENLDPENLKNPGPTGHGPDIC